MAGEEEVLGDDLPVLDDEALAQPDGKKVARFACETSWEEPEESFRSAAQGVLEVLAREHERLLAEREASLQLELARLRGELTCTATPSKAAKGRPISLPVSSRTNRQQSDAPCAKHLQFQECAAGDDALEGAPSTPHRSRSQSSFKAWHFAKIMSQSSGQSPSESAPVVTRNKTARAVINQAGDYIGKSASSSSPEKLVPLVAIVRRSVTSWVWETIMGCVIIFNTMTLGISSELYPSWDGWFYMDVCFAAIFTVELAAKLSFLGCKMAAWRKAWRWTLFEAVLVVLAWVEISWEMGASDVSDVVATSKSSLVRTLRLLRLAKLLRVFRLSVFCELLMMVNGASGSYKTLLYSALLVCIPLYSIALVMKETLQGMSTRGHGAEFFTHLDKAFFTLFRCFVGGDCTQDDGSPLFVLLTSTYGWAYGLLYCAVQFLMTFGLFNVISAIYVENTVSAAKYNELALKRQRLHDRDNFQENAERLLRLIWHRYQQLSPEQLALCKLRPVEELNTMSDREAASKMLLTREFFEDLCKQKAFSDILRDLDISDDDQYDLFKTLDPEGRCTISLMQLITGIDKLRGSARKADLVYCALQLQSLQHQLETLNRRV